MAAKVSKRLAFVPAGDGVANAVYTCPSGRKALVSHIHLANFGAAIQTASLSIDNGTYSTNICYNVSVMPGDPGVDFFSNPGYVLNAGDRLLAASGNTIGLLAMGYEELLE